jgi:hypothetical protein
VQLYDVMREFAAAGRRREPNERFWRFYEIVARTRNDPNRMTLAEEADIDEIFSGADLPISAEPSRTALASANG